MKAVQLTVVAFLLCLFFTASISAQVKDMPEMKSKLQKMNADYEKDMMEGKTDKMMAMYADDAISMPSYEKMKKGKGDIKIGMENGAKSGTKITNFKLNTMNVFGSGDLVVEIGTYDITMNMKGMNEPVKDNGKYMTVYEKQKDGSLKVKAETWNSDQNPWMDNGKMEEEKNDDMN